MADNAETPQAIAHILLKEVMNAEKKSTSDFQEGFTRIDRKYLLDTYAECLSATMGHRSISK
jgi:hypothetical protein